MSFTKASNRILKLRLELKEWEHAFATNHGGRKPSREEVKKDADIAAKYKEYRRLRASEEMAPGEARAEVGPDSISQSRRHSPKKPATVTPRKSTQSLPWDNDVYESPVSVHQRRLFGNRTRDSVGPTPQKNGNVLGLFESFMDVETTPVKDTASRTPTKTVECVLASPATQDVLTTPRKRKIGDVNSGTPSKNDDPGVLNTPPFLRRDKTRYIDIENSPPIPRPLGPPKRGLSSILAELRDMENHAFDDEEEAMRDMKSGTNGNNESASNASPMLAPAESELELPPPPPGAFSEEGIKDVEESLPVSETRVWKKKGLKRQTRRAIMRPVRVKKHESKLHGEQEDELVADNEELVSGNDSGSDYMGHDVDDDKHNAPHSKWPKVATNESALSVDKKPATMLVGKGKNIAKKAVRKVGIAAHANYRKLNIRNKNSKGKGRGGKFYRRR